MCNFFQVSLNYVVASES